MITIIITALVSVLTTLVIGYFIWSGISVRKLKKQVKDNKEVIHGNGEWIKNVEDMLFQKEKEIVDRIDETQDSLNDRINHVEHESYKSRDELNDNLRKEMDRRFDKVYQLLAEQKQ